MSDLEQHIRSVYKQGCETPIEDIIRLLELRGDDNLTLFRAADKIRRDYVGEGIYVRALITISTHCNETCTCNQGYDSTHERFRMSEGEIANVVHQAMHFGCTSVILQTGCDPDLTCGHLCEIIDRIRIFPRIGIGLTCGRRHVNEFKFFRQFGADRFYLRFETANQTSFERILPGEEWDKRVQSLAAARSNDMQITSGFLVGWPDSTTTQIAQDIQYASKWKLDQIWCDPFISQEDSPQTGKPLLDDRQIYFKTLAILRLMNPAAHILCSPAYNAVIKYGGDRGLLTGANTYIINMTPQRYDELGSVYSAFVEKKDRDAQDTSDLLQRVLKLNRHLGRDSGPSFQPDWVKAHPDDYEHA